MSGKWDAFLRVVQTLLTALLLVWMPWVSREIIVCEQFRVVGPRFTQKDAEALRNEIRIEVSTQLKLMNDQLIRLGLMLEQHMSQMQLKP